MVIRLARFAYFKFKIKLNEREIIAAEREADYYQSCILNAPQLAYDARNRAQALRVERAIIYATRDLK